MAEELRYHYISATALASMDDSGTALQNTTNDDMFIRRVEQHAVGRSAGSPGSTIIYQVSKDNAANIVDDDTTQRASELVTVGEADATPSMFANQSIRLFPKGAFTLEPNEKLHLNTLVVQGTTTAHRYGATIAYHF